MPDCEKLATEYENRRSVRLAQVDCTSQGGQGLCGKYSVQGYPTIKVFKFKSGGSKSGEDYNGPRDYNGIKRYIEANLAGPECSLEDKEGCDKEELVILEESEKMSTGDRRAKIKELEDSMKKKKEEYKQIEKDLKTIQKQIDITKLGGEKPDRLMQLLNDDEFREHCDTRTCVIAFLPHILDGSAKKRNEELAVLQSVFKKAKADGQPVGFMWAQGGDMFESEEKLQLSFGYPAVVAINIKKAKFGIHRGTFDKDQMVSFLSSMMVGRVPLQPIPNGFKWGKSKPWDGKDGEAPKEEDL